MWDAAASVAAESITVNPASWRVMEKASLILV
jgi:hypothetical protein